MPNNVKKILSTLVLLTLMLGMMATPVLAEFVDYTPTPDDGSGTDNTVQGIINAILAIVQSVAIGVAVIMLIVLAVKYISSAPNDKAEIKKHAVVYVVGAVILFASAGIIEIIKNFALNVVSMDV